jgi:hypothetical protein
MEVSLRYAKGGSSETGFIAGKTLPAYGENKKLDHDIIFALWGNPGRSGINLTGREIFSSDDLLQYTIQVKYINKRYHVILNNKEIYASPETGERPSTLWFGNPTGYRSAGLWPILQIDYIRIKAVP